MGLSPRSRRWSPKSADGRSSSELTCAEPEAERRIQNPSRGEFGKLRSLALYRNARESGAFVYPAMPGAGPVIDTGMLSPLEAETEVAAHLGISTD